MKSRSIFLFIFLSLLITSSICAQKVYYWKDEKGVMNVTTTPPPDNIKKYETDSYRKDTKAEIEQYQRQEEQKRRADEAIEEANRRAYQAQETAQRSAGRSAEQQDRRQREIQDIRNREADKLEAEARKTIPGARGMTASQRNTLENAARIRAGQETVTHTTSSQSPPHSKGAINVQTGEYYPPGADGIIEPKTGTLLPDVGGGYIDPRTGKFIPKVGP